MNIFFLIQLGQKIEVKIIKIDEDLKRISLSLKRMGAKKQPFYRIVAADSRSPRDGRFIETVGTYNSVANPAQVEINEER